MFHELAIFPFEEAVFALLIIALFLREFGRKSLGRETAEAVVFTLFGVVYIPWLFLFMAKILYLTPRDEGGFLTGQYLVLFVVAVTKFTDVGARVPSYTVAKTLEEKLHAAVFCHAPQVMKTIPLGP